MAPQTIDMEVAFAKTMINKAFDNDLIDGRALKAFRRVKKKLKMGANARKRTITIDEHLRLLNASSVHFRPTIETAFNTGMRGGEIRKLKWSYIDREAGFIRLPAEVTKEKKKKNIPINYHVKEILLSVPKFQAHDFVFTYNGKPYITVGGVSIAFSKVCKDSDIPAGRKDPNGVIFHDIRRTVKTNMLNAGMDKTHRDIILGHSLLGMDVHYIVPDEETLHQAMKKYTKWLEEQIAEAFAKVDQTVDQETTNKP